MGLKPPEIRLSTTAATMIEPRSTVPEAAKELGYSKWAVYDMIRDGEIGCIRRGNRSIRILQRHIDEFDQRFECPAKPLKGHGSGPSR